MIVWSTEFETGHKAIDDEHRKLVEGLNNLENALKTGAGRAEISNMIFFLDAYARQHFKHEEGHMKKTGCPAFADNCREHQAFLMRLGGWLQQLKNQPTTALVLEVHRETSAWIRNHMLKVDCKLRGCKVPAAAASS